jgi:hypothetical protein
MILPPPSKIVFVHALQARLPNAFVNHELPWSIPAHFREESYVVSKHSKPGDGRQIDPDDPAFLQYRERPHSPFCKQ